MNKELTPLENWKPVKEYIEYCFGWRNYCEAVTYTSTTQYLEPFINGVEKTLKDAEKYNKALEIIKEKKWLVEDILNAFIEDKEKHDLLVEVYGQYNCSNKEE